MTARPAKTTYSFTLLTGETAEIQSVKTITHVIVAEGMRYDSGKTVCQRDSWMATASSAKLAAKRVGTAVSRGFYGVVAVPVQVVG